MNKKYIKFIPLIFTLSLIMIMTSACQKVVNNTVVENPDGENGGEVASSSEKQGDFSEPTFKLVGKDDNGWNNYEIKNLKFKLKTPQNEEIFKIEKNIIYFNDFQIKVIPNNILSSDFKKVSANKVVCEIENISNCEKGHNNLREVDYFDINKDIIKAIELTGITLNDNEYGDFDLKYYYIRDDYIFVFVKKYIFPEKIENNTDIEKVINSFN